MYEFIDVTDFFIGAVNSLKAGTLSLHSPLEEMVLKVSARNLAYIDNRRDAKAKYGYDFWEDFDGSALKLAGIKKTLLYSQSAQFPDFIFKSRRHEDQLTGGSLLELKDSKGGVISSFNSTLPTKSKNLEEVDIVNGMNLVSKITSIKDGQLAKVADYRTYQRKCFYLVRTYRDDDRVKVSLVDGSFFETIPKDHLIYQMFLNILQDHINKKDIKVSPETLTEFQELLSHVTDQTIIASSQNIEKASVRPRLRIMAEVHSEGNPHSSVYHQIFEGSFNLIIHGALFTKELEEKLCSEVPEVEQLVIKHKRNGDHIVFQFKA